MGNKKLFYMCWLVILSVALIFGSTGITFAQGEDEFTLEEITVTAEKREAELQKVPIDISVVRPDDMEKLGVHTVYDMRKILPDMNASSMMGSSVIVTLRDVGGANTLWNAINETTTAMHLDGVQLTRINGFDNMFYDLQRVEVLKGPQGTLYGRGSTGGSMNILTQMPMLGEVNGRVSGEVGNFGLFRTESAINIPVADKLAFRVAGRILKRDGYNDAGYSDQDAWGSRLSMTWEPTDKDTITATVDAEGFNNNGYAYNNGYSFELYGGAEFRLNPAKDPSSPSYDPTLPVFEPEKLTGTLIELPYQLRWYLGNAVEDFVYIDNESWGAMFQWERDLSFAYGVLLYGHRKQEETSGWIASFGVSVRPVVDNAGNVSYAYLSGIPNTPPSGAAFIQHNSSDFDSLEFRLLSKETITGGDKYEWVAGLMGQKDSVIDGVLGGAYDMIKWMSVDTTSLGAFGQFAYQIFDDWNLSLGYRRSEDEKTYSGINEMAYYSPFYEAIPDGNGGYTRGLELTTYLYPTSFPFMKANGDVITDLRRVTAKWDKNTVKVNLSWNFAENAMTYAQYSKGYKTGDFNVDGDIITPETMDSYEVGFKTRFFNNRLQLNGTAYYYDYKNYTSWTSAYKCKTSVLDGAPFEGAYNDGICYSNTPGNFALEIDDYEYNKSIAVSPGGAEQMGANASIIYLLTAEDTFTFNGSLSNNKYKDYHLGKAILALYPDADNALLSESLQVSNDGVKFGGAPFNFNVGYTHTKFFNMDMLSFNTTAFYTGQGVDKELLRSKPDSVYTMPGTPSYWTVDASITYNSSRFLPEGMGWSARLWVNNMFDKEYLTSLSYSDFSTYYGANPGNGVATGYYGVPRTYGVTLTVNF